MWVKIQSALTQTTPTSMLFKHCPNQHVCCVVRSWTQEPLTFISSSRSAPVCVPRKLHTSQCPWETRAPKEIPPEAVNQYVDTMEELAGPVPSATGELDAEFQEDRNELKQEENGTYMDPDLLGYTDKLCSQEACVTKVEAVIHPSFLIDLLSPGPHLDLLALAEELEQEEGLTLEE
ncbi:NUT family member 2F, partial [Camelus dromedarius]